MHVVVGTAGHIDHGKTTLVRALTGVDCDRLPEEKARGITIDLGFARGDWNGARFAFVDVPGHERFVRNMLAGATGIDLALLVVAADESVRPQTREHLDILDLLAIPGGVVALTKCDRADATTRELSREEVRELLSGTGLSAAPIVEVSATTGEGLDRLREALSAEASRVLALRSDREALAARLPVDRVFSVKGFGTVVTGTLVSGRIASGDRLARLPMGTEVRVRGIEVHGESREAALAGERTSLNLAGVERTEIERGDVLASPGSLSISPMPTVRLRALPGARPIRNGERVRFHLGSADLVGRVHLPGRTELAAGESALAQIGLDGELPSRRGDRFVLRSLSPVATIGGGIVLDPRLDKIRAADAPEVWRVLTAGDASERLALLVRRRAFRGVLLSELPPRLGETAEETARLAAAGAFLRLGARLLDGALRERLEAEGRKILAAVAVADKTTTSMPLPEFSERALRRLPAECREPLLREWGEKKTFPIERDRVTLPGRKEGLGTTESDSARRILETYRKAGIRDAPSPAAVSRDLSIKPQIVEGLVRHLVSKGELLRLPGDWIVSRQAAEDVVAALRGSGRETIDVAGFKEMFGLTRKLAIPLLEWLDGAKVTRRTGDTRTILGGPK